jgi:hypothetical protein
MAFNILGSPTMARRCVVQLGALDILPISRSPMDQLHDALGGLVLQSKQTVQSGAKDLRRVKTYLARSRAMNMPSEFTYYRFHRMFLE